MTVARVFVVDDDPGIREHIPLLLETASLAAVCFARAEDFLAYGEPTGEGCLLLDVRMPGMTGPELQHELARRNVHLPIIFLTAHADLATGVEAMKGGAVDFLTKPINGALLLERVHAALAASREQTRVAQAREAFGARLRKLTDREREVLGFSLGGMANREIAARLAISVRTVEGHRSRILLKADFVSLFDIAQQATAAGIPLDRVAWLGQAKPA